MRHTSHAFYAKRGQTARENGYFKTQMKLLVRLTSYHFTG